MADSEHDYKRGDIVEILEVPVTHWCQTNDLPRYGKAGHYLTPGSTATVLSVGDIEGIWFVAVSGETDGHREEQIVPVDEVRLLRSAD